MIFCHYIACAWKLCTDIEIAIEGEENTWLDATNTPNSKWTDKVALYGSTTVSDTFGDGTIEKVVMILSGYSSLILEIKRVPIPDPVPPPREWVI